ncbi:MAG: anti-sigma factor antagonist, partial [Clostridia bacterium]|nr:anti-sigma factor antagonist [Clostridia bacterium]
MEKELFLSDYDEETGRITIKLCGEIDHHSAVMLRREIDEMLMELRPKKLVINLSSVEFMDSSGLGLIMGRYTLMEKLCGETVLQNPCERVKKILSLAGMERIIRIEKRKEKT